VRQNPNALYPQKVTKVQFDSQKVVFISMSSLFVCDSKTGDFLWNEKRIPMPKMEENLTSSEDAISKQNIHLEAISTQESNDNNSYSSSQESNQNNNPNLAIPARRKLDFNDISELEEERLIDAEETNMSYINISKSHNNDMGDTHGFDPALQENEQRNFGFEQINGLENTEDIAEDSYEDIGNVLNMSLDNIGEPSLRSPLFKNLKRKRNLNETLDDFESPIKRTKTSNNNKEENGNVDELTFPNLESTPDPKKITSPKKQRNVRSPSLALLEEEDELHDIISENNDELDNEEIDSVNENALGIFKTEPEAHFADAYETFHFDENILAVTLADAP